MKRCPGCKTEKPYDAYSRCRSKADGRQSRCRACVAKRQAGNKELVRDGQLWTKYRLRRTDLLRMEEDQGRCCAICFEPQDLTTFQIDHCHVSGQVRGLLCMRCNLGLGQFRDNTRLLAHAATYLEA